jgi:hypothetical protein
MVTDEVTRLNTGTGEMVDYPLPRSPNIRRVSWTTPQRRSISRPAAIMALQSSKSNRWIERLFAIGDPVSEQP